MPDNNWKVTKTEVRPLTSALIQPFRTALGDHNTLSNFLFIIYLGGRTGYAGEAAVATHITGETEEGTLSALNTAGEWITGKDIRNIRKFSAGLHECCAGYPSAVAAAETAVFNALASKKGVSLWRVFGRRCQILKSDITIVVADLKETRASVKKFYRKGFRIFKIKVGRDFDLDVRRVAAVAEIAPQCDLYLDANQGFDARTMLKFLKELKRMNIRPALLEQPVAYDDFDGLMKVTRSTDIPVCADESIRSLSDAKKIIRHKAAGVINIKLMKLGIVEALKVAGIAKKNKIGLMIGGMLESSTAMTAAAHMAAGLGGFDYIDLDTPFFIRGEAARNPYLSSNGTYDLSKCRKGIGIDWNRGKK